MPAPTRCNPLIPRRLSWLVLALALVAPLACAQQRDDAGFGAAVTAAEAGQLDAAASARWRTHPAYGWLEYAALRRDLDRTPPAQAQAFLQRYAGQAVAEAFRADWLASRSRVKDWAGFRAAWAPSVTGTALRCAELNARRDAGTTDARWVSDAQAIWRSTGKALPGGCGEVFTALDARGGLTPALRWERLDLAAAEGEPAVMRETATGLPAADQALAYDYAAYIAAPHARAAGWPRTARSRLVASYGLARAAKGDPGGVEAQLPALAQALGLNEAERGRVLYQVALWTVASYGPESARRLAAVPASAYDERLHEWRVREALSRSDWAAAREAIARMGAAQRGDSRWTWFEARTAELTGDKAAASAAYRRAATKPDFHGFLAADRLDQPYALCPWTPKDGAPAKAAVARDPALVRAVALFRAGRKGWAEREWSDALARFDDTQRRLAVEVAQDGGWFDRGVFGLVNVGGKRYPEETRLYGLRFPLHHDATIRREAARNRLDPAWVAAEIRAESVFDPNARSPANAMGLMQILPGTGAEAARKAGLPWAGAQSLYDSDTNIALGTAYLRQLMDRHGGKPFEVIAAYNAGPAPLNRWKTQRPGMDADIWIETISYKETREYVARVLSFSTVYDWRLNGDALRVSDRMHGRSGPRKQFACPAGS